jgi:hypothetical protein
VNEAGALASFEAVLDAADVCAGIEKMLPTGGRPRQLPVRTLLLGMMLALSDHRPAHLTRVHRALVALPESDRCRLCVTVAWRTGPHLLSYRQTERTFSLVVRALARDDPNGTPSDDLAAVVDALTEASVPERFKNATRSLAVDWSDMESFARGPLMSGGPTADPEASWGHRRGNAPGQKDESFFGFFLQAATMVRQEDGPPVPELARRIGLRACQHDPPQVFVPVLERMVKSGVPLGDVLDDSGYAHRRPEHWAVPMRRLGASLVQDLHPHDRGPKGTYSGATICNGNLYCPATPEALLALGPLARDATVEQTLAHDAQTQELARYKLGAITACDADGYRRVGCPATQGKLRCPLRPTSLALSVDHPEVLSPPETPPPCCCQQTTTVAPEVHAKTAQKHDYPSKAHRKSYARRSGAERTFSTAKDPATNDINRGWCRVMGLTAVTLFVACLFVVRNDRVVLAFEARQADNEKRAAAGLPLPTRRRQRRPLADLITSPP